MRPENRHVNAFQVAVHPSFSTGTTGPTTILPDVSTQVVLTPYMVQLMIISAFSVLGIQGKTKNSLQPWFVDSEALNHMTGTSDSLHIVRPYSRTQHIQIANGRTLLIAAVGILVRVFVMSLCRPNFLPV